MKFFSKVFWDAVLTKLIELSVSVKIWVLGWVSFLVYKIHNLGYTLNDFMLNNIHDLDPDKLTILSTLEKNLFDISTAMLTGVIVVILLSRHVFKHKRLDSEDENTIKDKME